MKPKRLTLRPAEVPRFLRPSGLVILLVKRKSDFQHAHPFTRDDGVGVVFTRHHNWTGVTNSETVYCPLGGPGSQWVGREAWATWNDGIDGGDGSGKLLLYRADKSAYHLHTDTVCEQHGIKAGDEILKADFNPLEHEGDEYAVKWKSAAAMPLDFARIRKTTTRVELRRVRTISDDEIKATGITPDRATDHPRGAWYTAFMAEFNARYPGEWDRDDYAWFVFYTDTH